MDWIIFALIAPFLWAVTSILNKIIRTNHVDDSYSYLMFIGGFALLPWLIIPFTGFSVTNYYLVPLIMFAGIIQTIATLFYLHSVHLEEISRLIAFGKIGSIFVLIFAAIFLGEKLIPRYYIAFALLVISGFLISVKKIKGMFKLSKGFIFLLIACVVNSLAWVIIKYVSGSMGYPEYFILNGTGVFIGSQFWWFTSKRKRAVEIFKKLTVKSKALITFTELISWGAFASLTYAVMLTSVSLVSAIGSFQPFFVFLFATILSFKFPQVLKEELNMNVLVLKFVSITILFVGLMLLYLK